MNLLDQLGSMAVFARIVETGSYTDAARLVDLSKSAVSKEIARLEASLGATLLRRTTRRIEVTEIGRAYYQYCARILAELNSADAFVQRYREEPAGNLRVIAPVTFGNRAVVPALCRFMEKNIHVQVDLELTDRTIDLSDERVDVAIVITANRPENALSQPLMPIGWGLYAAPDYLARNPPIRLPQDLTRHGFLSFGGPAHSPALPLRRHKKQIDLQVRHVLRSNNSVALLHAAVSGIGVAYLPQYVVDEALASGQLQRLLPEWSSETRIAYAAFRQDRFLSPQVRVFVEHLTRYFAETAPYVSPDVSV